MFNNRFAIVLFAGCGLMGCDRSPSTPSNDNKGSAQPAKSPAPATQPPAPAATKPAAPAQPPASAPASKPATDAQQPPKPAVNPTPQPPAASGHGAAMELGTIEVGGYQLKVVQNGLLAPGRAADFDVFVLAGEGKPTAVRLWIGSEDGKGARKIKVTVDKAGAHNHVPSANPIPEGAKLCVEVELSTGEKKVGTLAYKS